MWVRSLSLPPPHPLVLTGKGRSFLQPKLPTFPLRIFPVCVLDVSHIIKKWGAVAAFTAELCGGLVQFLFFVLCSLLGEVGVLLSFVSCTGIVYWFTGSLLFFCSHLHGVVHQQPLVMCILVTHTTQNTLTQILPLHFFCMNVP